MPATLSANPFAPIVDKYLYDSERYLREVLHLPQVYRWQRRVCVQYDERERHIAVKSGHGVGKSTLLAGLMTHHQLTRFPQKTVVTAPSSGQLWDALWATYKSFLQRIPPELLALLEESSDRVVLQPAPDMSFVSARTCRAETPEALAGVHADQSLGMGNEGVLLIADEASGVPDPVFESALGSMSGHNAITILTGNPVRTTGFFHDCFTKNSDIWKVHTVSSLDVPEAVDTIQYAKLVERSFGRYSNAYRVRVLGEFPTTESDAIIPLELVEAALGRDVKQNPLAPVVWGVDVARFGDDRSALAKRQGPVLLEKVKAWRHLETMQLAARIHSEYRETPFQLRPVEINVDAIGMGAGVADRLRQLGLPARAIQVSEAPAMVNADRYLNLRTELWFKAKEWFEDRMCSIPAAYKRVEKEDDLVAQLVSQKYDHLPSDKVFALSKKDMKRKHGIDSPDLADAFLLTFASDGARLAFGKRASTSWNQPIRRRLALLQ